MRFGRWLTISALAVALLGLPGATSVARADRVDDVVRTMSDPSWRVRLQAVVVLGRLNDKRAVPVLVRALRDPHETVRGMAAGVLADLGATDALPALRAASGDRNQFAHDKIALAMKKLDAAAAAQTPASIVTKAPEPARPGETHVEIAAIGAKARNTPPELTNHLREVVTRELKRTPGVTMDGPPGSGFSLDSSIVSITRRNTDQYVEISCEVSYVIGRLPSKAMVMMTSGGATVQAAKAGFRREFERNLQRDALEGAVRGAHENLLAFLKTQKTVTASAAPPARR